MPRGKGLLLLEQYFFDERVSDHLDLIDVQLNIHHSFRADFASWPTIAQLLVRFRPVTVDEFQVKRSNLVVYVDHFLSKRLGFCRLYPRLEVLVNIDSEGGADYPPAKRAFTLPLEQLLQAGDAEGVLAWQ